MTLSLAIPMIDLVIILITEEEINKIKVKEIDLGCLVILWEEINKVRLLYNILKMQKNIECCFFQGEEELKTQWNKITLTCSWIHAAQPLLVYRLRF